MRLEAVWRASLGVFVVLGATATRPARAQQAPDAGVELSCAQRRDACLATATTAQQRAECAADGALCEMQMGPGSSTQVVALTAPGPVSAPRPFRWSVRSVAVTGAGAVVRRARVDGSLRSAVREVGRACAAHTPSEVFVPSTLSVGAGGRVLSADAVTTLPELKSCIEGVLRRAAPPASAGAYTVTFELLARRP